MLDRADRLLEPEVFERLPLIAQRLFISRGAVLRECVLRGLAAFEADAGLEAVAPVAPARPRKRAKR